MIGRRLPVVGGKLTMPEHPGDYCGPVRGFTDDLEACFFLKPNARDADAPARARSVQHVTFPPHTYRECPDGSLEIRNSIGDTAGTSPESDGWHGYLDEGHVWRKV
jgi:hypothetical protein